jgi:hypothetical protein
MRVPSHALPRALTAVVTSTALLAFPALEAVGASSLARTPTGVVAGARLTTATHIVDASAAAARRGSTSIRFLDFDHTRPWGLYAYIRGQVIGTKAGQRGALKRVHVKIFRKLDSQQRFHLLGSRWTGRGPYPRFTFKTFALGNAVYKAVFSGNRNFQRSGGTSRVLVYRQMNAKLEDGSGSFHGFVRPKWNRRVVYLEKRSCAACSYHRVRSTKSGPYGYFRFVVPAPGSGRWWWRASTPPTSRFIWSYSAVFTTQLN